MRHRQFITLIGGAAVACGSRATGRACAPHRLTRLIADALSKVAQLDARRPQQFQNANIKFAALPLAGAPGTIIGVIARGLVRWTRSELRCGAR
jgi:hypothetical protein